MPEFPRDEFDDLAAQPGPVGAHRRKPSMVARVLIWLLVVVVAVGLGYAAGAYLWQARGNQGLPPIGDQPVVTTTQTLASTPTESPSPSPSESASPTPTETAQPVNLAAAVSVLNSSGISGLAGRNADELTAAGFTAVTAGNASANLPAANTVRYADATMETTAQQVAAVLGIATVEQGVTPEGDITVFLITNPDA